MNRTRRAVSAAAAAFVPAAAFAAAAFAPCAPAFADEPSVDRIWDEMSGEIRAGWRFLRDEEDGRFFQDRALQDGPRIFDAALRGETAREDAALTSFEAEAHGIGEEETSARLRFGNAGVWSFDGRWDRDDTSYRATGDAFPYDTTRTRGGLRLRWTPTTRVTVRADWDRSLRRGDANLSAYTDILDRSSTPTDVVRDRRPLSQQSDAATLGIDAVLGGGFRVSLAETLRLAQVDDTRLYEVPVSALGGSDPVFEALRRELRSPAWTTVAKAGWRSDDGRIDATAIASWTRQPVEARLGGSARGYDNRFDLAGVAPRAEFSSSTSGTSETDRSVRDLRLETSWRPSGDWEFVASAEQDGTTDDASIRRAERRVYDRPDVAPDTLRQSLDARIVNRMCRGSLEAEWEPHDDWRFRLGQEVLRENLRVPTDSRSSDFTPTDFSSTTWRTIAGADWDATKDLSFSLLVRRAMNDDPHAPTSAESADEISYRGRWKASDEWSLSTTYRHKGTRQDTDLDSASRSDSLTVAPSWTREGLSVTPSVTCQWIETRTDTTYFQLTGGGFTKVQDQAAYRTRDLIASLDARYDFSKTVRAFLTVTRVDSGRDYEAHWDDTALGGEWDLREGVTLGAALRAWRLDETDAFRDDYRTVGAEVWVTLRF